MAYSTSNPPILVSEGIGGKSSMWQYSHTDAIATVNTTGYITNGDALGMKVNDVVIVTDTATPTTSLCVVADVTTGGQADLTDGTAISRTDSD